TSGGRRLRQVRSALPPLFRPACRCPHGARGVDPLLTAPYSKRIIIHVSYSSTGHSINVHDKQIGCFPVNQNLPESRKRSQNVRGSGNEKLPRLVSTRKKSPQHRSTNRRTSSPNEPAGDLAKLSPRKSRSIQLRGNT